MILVDISQLFVASTFMSMKKEETEVDIKKLRYMILNSLRMYRKKYANEFGELVICCDGSLSWRKEIFPNYKAGRKTGREGSPLDWTQIFGCFDQLKKELKENFPYRLIQVDSAEADDIIGTLVIERRGSTSKVMIISSDKDFIQLQRYPNVYQWSPRTKKFIKEPEPEKQLRALIVKGDRTDGIPNILSGDTCLVEGLRQKPLSKRKILDWLNITPEKAFEGEILRNFKRNETLIDLGCIPDKIEINIRTRYESDQFLGRDRMLNYFIKHRLKDMTESIQEF